MPRDALDEFLDAPDIAAPEPSPGAYEPDTIDAFLDAPDIGLTGERPVEAALGPEPGPGAEIGRARSILGSTAQGAGQVVSAVPKAVAINRSKHERDLLALYDRIDTGEVADMGDLIGSSFSLTWKPPKQDPITGTMAQAYLMAKPERRKTLRAEIEGRVGQDPRDTDLYRAGTKFDDWLANTAKTNPKYREEFWSGKVPQGFGSMTAFMAATLATRGALMRSGVGPGVAGFTGAAGTGSLVGSVGGFEDAMVHGASIEDAYTAANFGAVTGLTEGVPISRLLTRLDKFSGGTIKAALINALKEGTEEAIQESFQVISENLVASEYYDPDRKWWSTAGEGGAVGFTTGALMAFLGTIITGGKLRMRQRAAQRQETVPEGTEVVSRETDEARLAAQADAAERLEGFMADERPADEVLAETRDQADEAATMEEVAEIDATGEETGVATENVDALAEQYGIPEVGDQAIVTWPDGESMQGIVMDLYEAEGADPADPTAGTWGATFQTDDGESYDVTGLDVEMTPVELATGAGKGTREAPTRVETAADVEAAAAQAEPAPTEAQKKSGTYKKGHVKFQGLDVSIENARGSIRSGTDQDGETWEVEMPAHYGYVKRTTGKDGDQVDVYIGENPESTAVYIVDQVNPDTGEFDEHKAMLGFASAEEAHQAYLAGFSDGRGEERHGAMTETHIEGFKNFLRDGDTTKTFSEQFAPAPEAAPEGDIVIQPIYQRPGQEDQGARIPVRQRQQRLEAIRRKIKEVEDRYTGDEALKRIEIETEIEVAETGDTVVIMQKAADALEEVEQRLTALRAVEDCLRGA